jgi:MrcB-like, N-terminal domain/AAA domain (dynein-related subfamily)
MLPNVSREKLLEAMETFDKELRDTDRWADWEQKGPHKYAIEYEGFRYPVKQIIRTATGETDFSGGYEANNYVSKRGLHVVTLQKGETEAEDMNIRDGLEEILTHYGAARANEPLTGHVLRLTFKGVSDAIAATGVVSKRPNLLGKLSMGQGVWAAIPWIALLDSRETHSIQRGVYCVYLFREDMSGVYLTLAQGVTEPKQRYGNVKKAREHLRARAKNLRQHCKELAQHGFALDDNIDLHTDAPLGRDYEASTIAHKFYATGSLPDDPKLVDDLEALLSAYNRYLEAKELEEVLATILSWIENLDTHRSRDRRFYYKPLVLLVLLDMLDADPDHDNGFEYDELREGFTRLAAERGSAVTEPQFSQPYFYMRRDDKPEQVQVWCLAATVDEESLDHIRGDNPARVRSAAPSAFVNPAVWPAFESQQGRDRIRQKIDEVYGMGTHPDGGGQLLDRGQLNVILYGPPGTGKTYSVQRRALRILDPTLAETTDAKASALYREYLAEGRIEFVTFHPSFSYEEFVEGYRYDEEMRIPTLHEGVFQRLVNRAVNPRQSASSAEGARIWKVSLGRPSETEILRRCIDNNEIAIGWFNDRDLTGYEKEDITELFRQQDGGERATNSINSVDYLVNGIREGDYVAVFRNQREIQAIGLVTGEYHYKGEGYDGLRHTRPVEWLDQQVRDIYELNGSTNLTRSTIYPLDRISLQDFVDLLPDKQKAEEPYVLVIDEINRGNLSRIFGELITLLEPDKRRGAQNELSVRLPYSQRLFTVPSNLYVVGTMNTADRSIALIDVALRRRFEFEEMMPDVEVIRDRLSASANDQTDVELTAEQVDLLCHVFEVLNRRIVVLLDRDHQIGHSYFLDAVSMDRLHQILYRRVFPLLQEYFYNDRERLQRVLGTYSLTGQKGFVAGMDAEYQGIFGDGHAGDDMPWEFHEYPVDKLETALRNTFPAP